MADTYTPVVYYRDDMDDYWGAQVVESGTTAHAVPAADMNLNALTVQFSRSTPSLLREDLAEFTIHLAHPSSGTLVALNAASEAAVEAIIDTWWTSEKVKHAPHITLSGYSWRYWAAGSADGSGGVTLHSPQHRFTSKSVAGTATAQSAPDQVAETITHRTASRRHWGRFYLPAINATFFDAYGRMTSTDVDAMAGYWHTAVASLIALSPSVEVYVLSPLYKGALSITQLQMDSTADVIRSRRAKQTAYFKRYTS